MSRALAAPIAGIIEKPAWSESDRAEISRWWGESVDRGNLGVSWVRRDEWQDLQRKRDRLFSMQDTTSRIIRADLYMTGPPYPGPR